MPVDNGPLDILKFKEIVQLESSRLKLRAFTGEGETLFTLALALTAAVKKIFFEKSETTFSSEPTIDKKLITLFAQKMRVDAMEKFNTTTVFATLELIAPKERLAKEDCLMTLVVYLEKSFLPDFLRLMQYPYIDSDEEDEVMDGCGTLVNLIAGQYKRELALLGYKDLMMTHFTSYINTAPNGVVVPLGTTDKYELSFEVEGVKRLVVELASMEMLPKWEILDNSPKKKILVIDDDLTLIKIIEPYLKANGFDVMVATDGEDGIKKLKWAPDLIILDIQMPLMDGYEFIVAKKNVRGSQDIPVIVLTAKEGMEDLFKFEGAREYLLKPLEPPILLKSIKRCLA